MIYTNNKCYKCNSIPRYMCSAGCGRPLCDGHVTKRNGGAYCIDHVPPKPQYTYPKRTDKWRFIGAASDHPGSIGCALALYTVVGLIGLYFLAVFMHWG